MAHWDKGDVFLAQLDDPSNTCCVLPKKVSVLTNIFYFGCDTNSWHSWQWLSSPERVTHDSWQVRTQNIFPLISIIRIFSVCSSFPFFWLGVPRTNGCITRPPLHDIRKQPRKLMNVFVWSWHGWHPGIILAPGDRWWWPGIVCQQVPPDFMIHNKPDVHKTRALIHATSFNSMHFYWLSIVILRLFIYNWIRA